MDIKQKRKLKEVIDEFSVMVSGYAIVLLPAALVYSYNSNAGLAGGFFGVIGILMGVTISDLIHAMNYINRREVK